jgi:hypothetical protein
MYTQQSTTATFPFAFRLNAMFTALRNGAKLIGRDSNPDRSDAGSSRLERHLQYDIGEIDYDPNLIKSFDDQGSYELRLLLHHYPR